jgi:hypothetical protein
VGLIVGLEEKRYNRREPTRLAPRTG